MVEGAWRGRGGGDGVRFGEVLVDVEVRRQINEGVGALVIDGELNELNFLGEVIPKDVLKFLM